MQLLYWAMENGHEHSFMCDKNIFKEYATSNEAGELNQEEYQAYIEEKENTRLADEVVIDFDELTVELAQEWLDNDYIAYFEVDDDEIIIEFY